MSTENFKLPEGVKYEDMDGVAISPGPRAHTHITSPWIPRLTLCGLRWRYHREMGTDVFCEKCQAKVRKIEEAN